MCYISSRVEVPNRRFYADILIPGEIEKQVGDSFRRSDLPSWDGRAARE
jgi:hypothetical protein